MKTRLFVCLAWTLIVANGFAGINIVAGYNFIAYQYYYNANNLNDIINSTTAAGISDGCVFYKYINNCACAQPWNLSLYTTASGWTPNDTLAPGEGAFLYSPAAFTITIPGSATAGTPRSSPFPLLPNNAYVLSDPAPELSNYGLLMDDVPASATKVVQWNSTTQVYHAATFGHGVWAGGTPSIAVGEAVQVVPALTGIVGPPDYMRFVMNGSSAILTWTCFGPCATGCALQSSTDLVTWTTIAGATSPYPVSPTVPTYYRSFCN